MNLCQNGVLDNLKNKEFYNITVADSVTSTNDMLKERAKQGAREGEVLIAKTQSKGKGRLGRTFYSKEDSGLYFSMVLRPGLKPHNAVLITTAASVAVARAIEKVSHKKAEIKWVNDIYISGKKVCGILVESGLLPNEEKLDYVVLGIGINVFNPKDGFNDEIKDIAAAVFEENVSDVRNKLCAYVLDNFYEIYSGIENKQFVTEYIKRSCVIGKKITILDGQTQKDAFCTGIDENCKLKVKYNDGNEELLSFGEISIRIGH